MNFNENIILDAYSDSANKQFDDLQERLSGIGNNFQSRMNGKTTSGLIGSLIGTLTWLAVFGLAVSLAWNYCEHMLLLIGSGAVVGLIIFVIIDRIMDFSYYGNISSYKNSISLLKNRVSIGKSSIKTNNDAFLNSKINGWRFLLKAAPSIPDEATSAETTMANMESLKKGFINGAKNFFYFASVLAVAVTGAVALFPVAEEIMNIGGHGPSGDIALVLNIIALVIAAIGTVILAKLIWSKTDCNVNNVTIFATVIGPVAFLVLIGLGTLIVYLAIAMFYILILIAAVAIVFACVCGG